VKEKEEYLTTNHTNHTNHPNRYKLELFVRAVRVVRGKILIHVRSCPFVVKFLFISIHGLITPIGTKNMTYSLIENMIQSKQSKD